MIVDENDRNDLIPYLSVTRMEEAWNDESSKTYESSKKQVIRRMIAKISNQETLMQVLRTYD